jgi:hypothetical protein
MKSAVSAINEIPIGTLLSHRNGLRDLEAGCFTEIQVDDRGHARRAGAFREDISDCSALDFVTNCTISVRHFYIPKNLLDVRIVLGYTLT